MFVHNQLILSDHGICINQTCGGPEEDALVTLLYDCMAITGRGLISRYLRNCLADYDASNTTTLTKEMRRKTKALIATLDAMEQ